MNKRHIIAFAVCSLVCMANAAWYWPFGSDEKKVPRVSELVETASRLIDEANDLADEKKVDEAVAKYKEALQELDRVEIENPERAATGEFATLRNKRAYVKSAIDSLIFAQTRENARAITVTDTSELEKKYKAEKSGVKPDAVAKAEKKPAEQVKASPKTGSSRREAITRLVAKDPQNYRARLLLAAEDMQDGDYQAALLAIEDLLAVKPNDAAALNLKAAVEARKGDYAAAERALDAAVKSNPRSTAAYCNMARLYLVTRGAAGKAAARRYYETARRYGLGRDAALEAALK